MGDTLTSGQRLRADLEAQVLELQRELNAGSDEEVSLVWEPRELAVLRMIEDTADRIEQLDSLVARDGLMVAGSKGQDRLHPAVQEARMARAELSRLLDRLQLPASGGVDEERPKNPAKQRAANYRWSMERAQW